MTPRASHRRVRAAAALWLTALALSGITLPACGKKGPPLAPLLRVPARPEPIAARRLGSVVYVQVRVPDQNQDGSAPADITRLEVYGYTGEPRATADVVKYGALVATLPIRRPPEPEPPPAKAGQTGTSQASEPLKPSPPRGPATPAYEPGAVVTVPETLGPAALRPVILPGAGRFVVAAKPLVSPPLLGPSASDLPVRVYVAVGYNHRGQRGAPSGRVTVPLVDAPQPPAAPSLAHTADRITLSWQPPARLRRPVQEAATGGVLASVPRVDVLPASAYNVYEVSRPSAGPQPSGSQPLPYAVPLPTPLNERPISGITFEDPRVVFGAERCYVVRTVDTVGPRETVESEASAVACVTPKDTFAPAAPRGLQAVAGDGAVSLIWEPNTEADVAGYFVLRGIAPGGTLDRLNAEPVRETTFSDTTARPGVRYVYAVVAVDTAVPPNSSVLSNKVEVAAR